MIKETVVAQENFDMLLGWLDPDRERAGEKYEKIRLRVIRLFAGRGCHEAETLADEVINRVTRKLPSIIEDYDGEPLRYFYGVAHKTHLEWLKKQRRLSGAPLPEDYAARAPDKVPEYEFLEKCLKKLPAADRELIVEYYSEDKSLKISHRRSLAAALDITLSALQVKTYRIRNKLHDCIRKTAAAKNN